MTLKEDNMTTDFENNSVDSEKKTFDFSDEFQKKIASAILTDSKFAAQIYEVLEIDYFTPKWIKVIIGEHKDFFKKYNTFPSFDVLTQIIQQKYLSTDNAKSAAVGNLIGSFLESTIHTDWKELKYVKEQALEFCRKSLMQKTLIEAVDVLAKTNDPSRYERIHSLVNKTTLAGSETTAGLSLEKDVESRYNVLTRKTVPTGVAELDDIKILNGGLGNGEFGIVISPSGGGKSHWLTQFGAAAMIAGKNVVHFTFELKESLVATRYDSNLVGIPSLECKEHTGLIQNYYDNNNLGKLRIKFYPTGTATVNTLRSYLEKLQSTEGFIPHLIIVDYAGIMRSTQRSESIRHELKFITEELRALAEEYDCPLWTALQSNRDGVDADFLDINNLAESFSQAFIADFILGWSRKLEEKVSGIGTARVIKNRAGFDGINYIMAMDTSRSRIESMKDLSNLSNSTDPKLKKEMTKDSIRNAILPKEPASSFVSALSTTGIKH